MGRVKAAAVCSQKLDCDGGLVAIGELAGAQPEPLGRALVEMVRRIPAQHLHVPAPQARVRSGRQARAARANHSSTSATGTTTAPAHAMPVEKGPVRAIHHDFGRICSGVAGSAKPCPETAPPITTSASPTAHSSSRIRRAPTSIEISGTPMPAKRARTERPPCRVPRPQPAARTRQRGPRRRCSSAATLLKHLVGHGVIGLALVA